MILDFLSSAGFSIHDIIGPLVGGAMGFFASRYIAKSNEKIADKRHELLLDSDLTARFKALMDGYEARITDLTAEVMSLREQVERLIKQRGPDASV